MIGPVHLRMARAGLGWNLQDLANRAGINPNTISRFEAGNDILSRKLQRLEAALVEAGVVFIDEGGTLGVKVPYRDVGGQNQTAPSAARTPHKA